MMRKSLMTVMAAVAFGGLFTGCTKETEGAEGVSSAQLDIVQKYEETFINRFGQPAETQTWGFGSASSGTRAVVDQPTVTEIGNTFNTTMTIAADGATAASVNAGSYSSWTGSGWRDKFYRVNGTVIPSNISSQLKAAIINKILGPDGIPENTNNLTKANELGYAIVTEGGPVTLTPVYHQSSSGDMISYYYYPQNTNPDVKSLKKYTIGYMAEPEECKTNITALKENTYSLVYEDENGNVSYDFPANYVINFIVSNVDLLHNYPLDGVYEAGATTLTSQGKYQVEADRYYTIGESVNTDFAEIRFGKQLNIPQFTMKNEAVNGPSYGNTHFNYRILGNDVNGDLNGGSTVYYFQPTENGIIRAGVSLNQGKELYIKDLGINGWYNTTETSLEGFPVSYDYKFDQIVSFSVEKDKVYALYADGSKLGFYGFMFEYQYWKQEWYSWQTAVEEDGVFTRVMGPFNCGDQFGLGKVNFRFGRKPAFEKSKANGYIDGYTALTEGTGVDGDLTSDRATVYYIKPKSSGEMEVAVALNSGRNFYIKDLGVDGWNSTSGSSLADYDGITVAEKKYDKYRFPVEANHVYAVYAEGSKLGFYGCEFFTRSTSAGTTKNVDNYPEFYGDGTYNQAVHSSGYSQWAIPGAPTTPHAAVFNTELTDENNKKVKVSLIGFEDWTDLDFNDVIFAVTGAEPEIEQPPVIIDVPDPDPEPLFRIVAEDLTVDERGDFDFNDVVFDVLPNDNGTTTLLIRAVGGELPLFIGLEGDALDDAHDVHKVCGLGAKSMTNTGWDNGGVINYKKVCGRITLNTTINTRPAARELIYIRVIKKGETIRLSANPGRVPSMICVGTDYEWCRERDDIDDTYHNESTGAKFFSMYVGGELGEDWYKQPR